LGLEQFDTSSSEEGIDMPVLRPDNGEPLLQDDGKTPVTVCVAGTDSDRYRKAELANRTRYIRKRDKTFRAEDIETNEMNILVGITVSWSGIVVDGETLDCTPDNIRKVYTRFKFIRDQVNAFAGERANFLPASATN